MPRQQRFTHYGRSLLKALGVPVHNTWGLCPARVTGTTQTAPITAIRDLDKPGLLKDVTALSFHRHLPHYEITDKNSRAIHVLARQPIEPERPHPFTAAGNTEIQLPPVDAAGEATRRRHRTGGLDPLHDAVWRDGESEELLAERRHHEMNAARR